MFLRNQATGVETGAHVVGKVAFIIAQVYWIWFVILGWFAEIRLSLVLLPFILCSPFINCRCDVYRRIRFVGALRRYGCFVNDLRLSSHLSRPPYPHSPRPHLLRPSSPRQRLAVLRVLSLHSSRYVQRRQHSRPQQHWENHFDG